MRSRSSAAAAIAACGLSMTVGAYAADAPPPELPRADCSKRWVDPAGDAFVVSGVASTAAPGLDIQSLFLRSTPEDVQVFLKIKDIPAAASMPATDPAYRYTVNFKHGTQVFSLIHVQFNPQHSALASGQYPQALPAGTTGATGKIDPVTDIVYMRLARTMIESKSAGNPVVDGGMFTDISAAAHWDGSTERARLLADDLKPAGDAAKWTVGDDYCFGAPPAALSDVTAPAVQFGDVTTLSAKLVNEKGEPLANEQVSFAVDGSRTPVTATTGADGVAKAAYVADVAAGTRAVSATFAGSEAGGNTAAAGSLVVRAEVTKFAALAVKKTSTTARTVTATLRDDDGKAVAGQKVGWYVGGKLVSTVVTDSAGRAVYKGAKAGQVVQARYAGLSGKYTAAKSNAPKV